MVKLFSEGPLGKGMIPYLLDSVVMVTDKNGPQLKTCQAFIQLKPLLLLRTWGSQAVWIFHNFTIQFSACKSFEMPPEWWRAGTCLGSWAAHIILSPGLQLSADSLISERNKDLTWRSFKRAQSYRHSLCSVSLFSKSWYGCRYYGNTDLCFLFQRMNSFLIQNRVLVQMWGLPY